MKAFAIALVIAGGSLGAGSVRAEPTYEDIVEALRRDGMRSNECIETGNGGLGDFYRQYDAAPGGYYTAVFPAPRGCNWADLEPLEIISIKTVSDQYFCEPHESNRWSCIVIVEERTLDGEASVPAPGGGWNRIPRKLTLDQFKALVALEPPESAKRRFFIPKEP